MRNFRLTNKHIYSYTRKWIPYIFSIARLLLPGYTNCSIKPQIQNKVYNYKSSKTISPDFLWEWHNPLVANQLSEADHSTLFLLDTRTLVDFQTVSCDIRSSLWQILHLSEIYVYEINKIERDVLDYIQQFIYVEMKYFWINNGSCECRLSRNGWRHAELLQNNMYFRKQFECMYWWIIHLKQIWLSVHIPVTQTLPHKSARFITARNKDRIQ